MAYPDATQGTTSFNAIEVQAIVVGTLSGSMTDVSVEEETIVTGTSGTFGNITATNIMNSLHINWNGTATGTKAVVSTLTAGQAGVAGTITGTQVDATTGNVKTLNGSTVTGSIVTCPNIVGSVQTGSQATLKEVIGSTMSGSSLTLPAGMPGLAQVVAGTTHGTAGVASTHNHTLGVAPSAVIIQEKNDSGTAGVTLASKGTAIFTVKGAIASVAFDGFVIK